MFLKRCLAACTAVIAALAVLVGPAGAATAPASDSALASPGCVNYYAGPTQLAGGCPLAFPAGPAAATTTSASDSALGSPRCPDSYSGPTNLATGCPWWMIH